MTFGFGTWSRIDRLVNAREETGEGLRLRKEIEARVLREVGHRAVRIDVIEAIGRGKNYKFRVELRAAYFRLLDARRLVHTPDGRVLVQQGLIVTGRAIPPK